MERQSLLFDVSAVVLSTLFRTLLRVRVYGLENIPATGPVILAINHASYLDPPLAGCFVGLRRYFRGIGKKEIFDVPFVGWYLKTIGCFPVDRDRGDRGAMRVALSILKNQEMLLMAPEGTRGVSGRPHTPKPGVGFIAHHAGAPVVPIRLAGTDFPPVPGRVWIRFGEPIRYDPAEDYQTFANNLMTRIYAMTE